MQIRHRTTATFALCAMLAGAAHAADQTILGNQLQVKDPKGLTDASKRKLLGKAKERNSPNTIVGDPTVLGATLTFRANGGTPTTQSFPLLQGTSSIGKPFWTAKPGQFLYKDPKGDQGPIKLVQIKKTPSGIFQIKAIALGKNGPGPQPHIVVVPPNLGTDGCILLEITGGDSYSVAFLPGDGLITNHDGQLYKHKKVTLEGSCVITTTTTTITTTTTTTTTTTVTTTTTTTTTVTSTTTTTLYGSPSRAFVERVRGLLD